MIFKDRVDAGKKLTHVLLDKLSPAKRKQAVVVSLLRGGVIVGDIIAKRLGIAHCPLVVTKISSPFNFEYAIGALCQNIVYFNRGELSPIDKKSEITKLQVQIAKIKNKEYQKKYQISKIKYQKLLLNKTVLLVDDGIATGATIFAAHKFIKFCKPKQIILCIPVAPNGFNTACFNNTYIHHVSSSFSAVSQFYAYFPQVSDNEVAKTLNIKS